MTSKTTDHLGYDAYANSLWARIEAALDKDVPAGSVLGDDPLVVGIFGEWGAGKSKLLSLIQERATLHMKAQQEVRENDPGFSLTVPVFFQPWKYEHEQHLHVPLVMHVIAALKDALKGEVGVVKALQTTVSTAAVSAAKAGVIVNKAAKFTSAAYPWIRRVLGSINVFGVSIQLPELPDEWLESIEDGTASATEMLEKQNNTAGTKKEEHDKGAIKYTSDGLYFYRINELLQNLTRPAKDLWLKKELKSDAFTQNTRINFVIFIDDLDRCLPENAVGTLELIKTIFNVESFAFVLALDDEVIERGIGHRYKEYAIGNKKPELPITGFEYLEKIVHVPFRLPALTAAQGANFVRQYEASIQKDAGLRWFDKPQSVSDDKVGGMRQSQLDLWPLVQASFDAYVPRKLIRMVELMHQTDAIAKLRPGKTLSKNLSATIDVRVVLSLILIQLFQPELYRLMRRRMDSFPFLLGAFANQKFKTPHVSDIDLWRWVANVAVEAEISDSPSNLSEAIRTISHLPEEQRADAQQVRLPLVEQLIFHRAVQRHAFDALKLFHKLAQEMGEAAKSVTIAPYFSLLGKEEETAPSVAVKNDKQDLDTRQRFKVSDVQRLFNDWVNDDDAVVANIVSRNDLPANSVLAAETVQQVLGLVKPETDKERLLNGLQYLAPYLAKDDGEKFWNSVKDLNPIPTKPNDITRAPKLAALYADVRYLLGQDDRFEPTHFYLPREKWNKNSEQQEPIDGFVRIEDAQPFYMARTLTTVDQFGAFVKAGGYDNKELLEKLWDKQGLAWLEGKDVKRPLNWDEQQIMGVRPVWGVTWFEARAYARWLNLQLKDEIASHEALSGYQITLPTEAHWERAAKQGTPQANTGKASGLPTYPWGDDDGKPELRSNIEKSEIKRASAVGVFAPNSLGLLDLSGNLWEWQNNLYSGKNDKFDVILKDRVLVSQEKWEDAEHVALRGGSWFGDPEFARVSYRNRYRPDDWNYGIGFRVMLSLANLKSAT